MVACRRMVWLLLLALGWGLALMASGPAKAEYGDVVINNYSDIAWGVENCNLCHSGKPGTPTQVHESAMQKLATPQPARKK